MKGRLSPFSTQLWIRTLRFCLQPCSAFSDTVPLLALPFLPAFPIILILPEQSTFGQAGGAEPGGAAGGAGCPRDAQEQCLRGVSKGAQVSPPVGWVMEDEEWQMQDFSLRSSQALQPGSSKLLVGLHSLPAQSCASGLCNNCFGWCHSHFTLEHIITQEQIQH